MAKEIQTNKPVIETVINTCALALTAFGVQQVTTQGVIWQGYLAIAAGMSLEFFKYWGRNKKFW